LLELAFLVVLDQREPHEHRVLAEIGTVNVGAKSPDEPMYRVFGK
jgi:hypothetical protein